MSNNKNSKTLIIIISVLVVLTFLGIILYSLKAQSDLKKLATANPTLIPSKSPSPELESPTPTISPSLSPSPTASPTQSGQDYKIPEGETLLLTDQKDTNNDTKKETLVITQTKDSKYHAYILSNEGNVLFDHPDLGQKPVRITAQIYGANETFLSWMIIYTEQSSNLAFIHWNGTKYEIPKEEFGI